MLRVTVLDHLEETSVEQDILRGIADVRPLADSGWSRDEAIASSDALMMWHIDRLTAGDIDRIGRARIIQRVGVGFDNVDLAAARARSLPVCNVPDYGTEDVADHAVALMLSLARGLWSYGLAVRHDGAAGWSWHRGGRGNIRLRGLTLGLVGAGRIGTAVALRAKVFGMRVVIYDPYVPDGYEKAIGVDRVRTLHELAEADILSVHTPLTPETRGMIDAQFFAASKRAMMVINTARGPIVSEGALCDAYRRGRVSGIGLDVLESEPLQDSSNLACLLRDLPKAAADVLITPHSAFFSPQAYHELRSKAAENVRRCLLDGTHRNIVN